MLHSGRGGESQASRRGPRVGVARAARLRPQCRGRSHGLTVGVLGQPLQRRSARAPRGPGPGARGSSPASRPGPGRPGCQCRRDSPRGGPSGAAAAGPDPAPARLSGAGGATRARPGKRHWQAAGPASARRLESWETRGKAGSGGRRRPSGAAACAAAHRAQRVAAGPGSRRGPGISGQATSVGPAARRRFHISAFFCVLVGAVGGY